MSTHRRLTMLLALLGILSFMLAATGCTTWIKARIVYGKLVESFEDSERRRD